MQDVTPKWSASGLVLVCKKCSEERIPEESPEIAARIGDFSLRDWLKAELKERGIWGRVRVLGTSCMDVCARGKVTVCIDPQAEGRAAETFVVDPLEERDAVLARILARFGPG